MELEAWSETLGESVRLLAARPQRGCGSDRGDDDLPVVWLLHGRGAPYDEVRRLVASLGAAMDSGRLARHIILAPWSPWLDGAGWWVDSPSPGGRLLESAMLHDVLPHVERVWGLAPGPGRRIVAGYSMGGGAALRWLLTRDDLFGAAALVAPAAYSVAPPIESSARTSGAFRLGSEPFDQPTWEHLMSYRRLLLDERRDPRAPAPVAIVVGDREPIQAYPGERSSLTVEAARLHTSLVESQGLRSSLRVIDGGHTDELWAPGLAMALGLLGLAGPR